MKLKKICSLGFCLLLVGVNVSGQTGGSKRTLQNCLDIALANNIPVKQTELQKQAAEANLNQSKFNRLPDVSASVNYGIQNGRSIDPFTNSYNNRQLSASNAGIAASVPVFKGFQANNAIQQASLNYQASAWELQQERDNLTLNVILAYLQLMNDEDVLKLTKEQMLVTQKQVERLDLLNREGAIKPAEFYDMKGQFASDQVSLANAAGALEMSKLNLARLMNVPYDKDMKFSREGIDPATAKYAATADEINMSALQNLAMVKAADLRTKAAEKARKVAVADLYPTLSLFGQLGTNFSSAASTSMPLSSMDIATSDYVVVNGSKVPVMTTETKYNSQKIGFFNQYKNNISTYFGVNLSIPVFSSFQTRTNIKLAKLEEKRTTYVAENARIQLRQAIDQAYVNMTTAFEKYRAVNEQVSAYSESFRAADIRFNLGASNSIEYLIVKNNFDRATINLTIARYEYMLRTKVLDFYQGKL